MGKENKRLRKCSTSTDVEAATKPLQKGERDLENLETDVNPKKQQKQQIDEDDLEPKSKQKKLKKTSEKKEMKELKKSFKEMTETMKNLQEFLQGKASLQGMQLRAEDVPWNAKAKEEEPTKEIEELATYECNFKTDESEGNNRQTIFVRGFDSSLPRDEIKRALSEHFSSCGIVVRRVYVPIECMTGASLGFAFVDVEDDEKALHDTRHYMGKWLLNVSMASYQDEYYGFASFHGCKDCAGYKMERKLNRFYRRRY